VSADDSLLQRAIEAHKGGRLAEAEVVYRRLLRKNPRHADALNFLGMLSCQSGDTQSAITLLRKSVAADPSNPHAWLNLGNVLLAGGQAEEAREAFTKATQLAPGLPMAWFNLGVCLGRCRRPREAASALHEALKLEPGYLPGYESLANTLQRLGSYEEAIEVYREWLKYEPDNPIARHMLAATSDRDVPVRADDAYVRRLFDEFAESFDENLTSLGYRAPEWVSERLAREVGSTAGLDILDAGCGTGLCGPRLRPMAARLVGVDLSGAMVEKARERQVYDELIVHELVDFMHLHPASFDAIVSADTLVYFGALEAPCAAARASLRGKGTLIFTVESLDAAGSTKPYRLEPHGRYSHGAAYLREVGRRSGFGVISLETQVLRRDKGQNVLGHVVRMEAG
jgi:predicted TPR repeat methyltransferase